MTTSPSAPSTCRGPIDQVLETAKGMSAEEPSESAAAEAAEQEAKEEEKAETEEAAA